MREDGFGGWSGPCPNKISSLVQQVGTAALEKLRVPNLGLCGCVAFSSLIKLALQEASLKVNMVRREWALGPMNTAKESLVRH